MDADILVDLSPHARLPAQVRETPETDQRVSVYILPYPLALSVEKIFPSV